MFDLLDRPLVWIGVAWPGLVQKDETGVAEVTEHRVELQVEILDRSDYAKWLDDGEKQARDDGVDEEAELALVLQVTRAWRKVVANGTPIAFSPDNLARLLRAPGFIPAFSIAYGNAWAGKAETREGNSASSPAHGRADAATAATETAAT